MKPTRTPKTKPASSYRRTCQKCQGAGEVPWNDGRQERGHYTLVKCGRCKGTGKVTITPAKPAPARVKRKVPIPKGWRRLRVGDNRPKDYKWFYGCYFEHGYDVLIGTPITSQDNQQSGPYIGKIKARAALSSIGLDAKGGK